MIEVGMYQQNTPANFWKIMEPIEPMVWEQAICLALDHLGIPCDCQEEIIRWSLGEGSYGDHQWQLSIPKQVYYHLKPLIPQHVSKVFRQFLQRIKQHANPVCNHWPIDERYVQYLWLVLIYVMKLLDCSEFEMAGFWPQQKRNAFVLTHDIETGEGQDYVEKVVEIECNLGLKSAFFFVINRYNLDYDLIHSLQERGFEVGIHGFKHDGKLFCFSKCPLERIQKINDFAEKNHVQSFRSPLTLRHPERMQLLDVQYDLSFFDTDPYEPIPGGTMSIFPFQMGKLVELPYTLPQDYTLFELLQETTAQIWMKKVDFLRRYHGMILLDTHPDYLMRRDNLQKYQDFLQQINTEESRLFHALPSEVGSWWKKRTAITTGATVDGVTLTQVVLDPRTQELSLEF